MAQKNPYLDTFEFTVTNLKQELKFITRGIKELEKELLLIQAALLRRVAKKAAK